MCHSYSNLQRRFQNKNGRVFDVKKNIPNVDISFAKDASPDKRSYKVDFSLFKSLAPDHQPIQKLDNSIMEIADGITNSELNVSNQISESQTPVTAKGLSW